MKVSHAKFNYLSISADANQNLCDNVQGSSAPDQSKNVHEFEMACKQTVEKLSNDDDLLFWVDGNGSSPWHECRQGHITGTTAKNLLRAIKLEILDDARLGSMSRTLLESIGLSLRRPVDSDLQGKPVNELKKACKALGFMDIITADEMKDCLKKQWASKQTSFKNWSHHGAWLQ